MQSRITSLAGEMRRSKHHLAICPGKTDSSPQLFLKSSACQKYLAVICEHDILESTKHNIETCQL